jgi:AmiR/NasT family two-component response regulator
MPVKAPGGPSRILLADDDALIRLDLANALADAGYTVVASVENGAQAVQAARRYRPHVAIFDVKMPELDGIEAARTLHEEKIAPVVLLTAFSQVELVRRAMAAGVYSYLVKPFHPPALISALEIADSRWREIQASEQKLRALQAKEETRAIVDCAKRVLMTSCGLTEVRAYRFIQARSMSSRRSMRAVASAILRSQDTLPQDLAVLLARSEQVNGTAHAAIAQQNASYSIPDFQTADYQNSPYRTKESAL